MMPNMAAYSDSFSVPPRTPIEIDLDRTDESDGTRLIRRKTTRYLGDRQLAEIRFLYEKYQHGRAVESYIDDFASHVFFPRELELLFIHAGFEIERTVGDYRVEAARGGIRRSSIMTGKTFWIADGQTGKTMTGTGSVETALLYLTDRRENAKDNATGWPGRSAPRSVTIADARTRGAPSLDRREEIQ